MKDQNLQRFQKNLLRTLEDSGFTIEKILDNGPFALATILDIDNQVTKIIFSETEKVALNYIISDCN